MGSVLTYNVKLNMTEETFLYWNNLLEQVRDCYNYCSKAVKQLNLPLSLKVVHSELYHELRNQFPLIPSQAVIKVQQDVIAAYRSIKKNKHKAADTPQKKYLSMRLDKRTSSYFDITGISIVGPKSGKRDRVTFNLYPKVEEMFRKYTTTDPLLFIRDGVPYLSVSFNVPQKPIQETKCVGVDLGERFLFVTSEGKAFRDKTYLRERRKAVYLKRCLQSKGTKSAKRKLRKLSKKVRNLSNDMCHMACNELLRSTDASIIVLEDLKKLKQNTSSKKKNGRKNTGHNRRLGQVPFYKFKEMLTYKAPLCGKRVETVSAYNTSQTDCRTGKTDGIRIKRRYVGADCIVLDADYNAAVNIAKKGKHPFSMNVPLDGTLTILKGRPSSIGQSSHVRCVGTSPLL